MISKTTASLPVFWARHKRLVDRWLDALFSARRPYPPRLYQIMQYALGQGGKRLRPVLLLEAARACGKVPVRGLRAAACAVEMIHAYSLVHDDLPCMDNSPTRRGQPSCHKKFGESEALLAGDALLTHAFGVLSQGVDPPKLPRVMDTLIQRAGAGGMIGGQFVEEEMKGKDWTDPVRAYIYTHKTGNLITGSLEIGGILAGATPSQSKALAQFGEYVGYTFQLIDDVLDGDGFAAVAGRSAVEEEARGLTHRAIRALHPLGARGRRLRTLAAYLLHRSQ